MSRNEIGLNITPGLAELRAARRSSNTVLLAVALFSVAVNLLLLTGPLYMLQVYDRVLGSRSEPTLFALTALIVFLFLVMGILDHARGRVMARVGASFQARRDRLGSALRDIGFDVFDSFGTYFLCVDPRPLGFSDSRTFCAELPEKVGVAAIPMASEKGLGFRSV